MSLEFLPTRGDVWQAFEGEAGGAKAAEGRKPGNAEVTEGGERRPDLRDRSQKLSHHQGTKTPKRILALTIRDGRN